MNNRLVQKQIVDKNGKATTVHVIADKGSPRLAKIRAIKAPVDPAIALRKPINDALKLLNSQGWDKFPLEMQDAAILAVNSPNADESVFRKAKRLADAAESWNFHDCCLQLNAAIGRARHEENPNDELTEVYSMAYDSRTPPDLLQRIYDENGDRITSLATNTNTPANVLVAMSNNEQGWIRENVASNPSTPVETLDVLALDEDWRVRYGVTQNQNTSPNTLVSLREDENENVVRHAKLATALWLD